MTSRSSLVALKLVLLVALLPISWACALTPTHHLVWEPIVEGPATQPADPEPEPRP